MTGGGRVDERKENAGDDLKAQDDGGCAAEYIPPTGGAGGHFMHSRRYGRLAKAEAPFEPVVKCDTAFSQPWHEAHPGLGFSIETSFANPSRCVRGGSVHAFSARVGILPTLIIKVLAMILWSYSNRPRSGGPEARDPSA